MRCGNGLANGNGLRAQGWEVHGMDIAISLLHTWKEGAGGDLKVLAVQADVHFLPYPAQVFFATCCFQSTWYFSHLGRAIDEMFRVTVPRGYVIFDVMNNWNWPIFYFHVKGWVRMKGRLLKRWMLSRPTDDLVIYEEGTTPLAVARMLRGHSHSVAVYEPTSFGELRAAKWKSWRLIYVCRKPL